MTTNHHFAWSGSVTRRRLIATGSAALGSGMLLAACGGDSKSPTSSQTGAVAPGTPKAGGTLRLPVVFTSGHFDIHQFQTGYQMAVWRCCGNGIFTINPATGEAVGDLAREWSFPDPTTLVIKLRPEARWQDKQPLGGRPVTARDVKFSLERLATKSADFVRSSDYALVERIEAPDAETVRITLSRPYVALVNMLANFQAVIVAPEVVERFGDLKKAEAMIGSGPFTVERADASTGARVVRNRAYWEPGLPYLDAVEWTIVNDPQTSLAAFRSGEFDLHVIDAIDAPSFSGNKEITIERYLNPQYFVQGLGGPLDRAPLDDPRVRQAIDLAVDRDALGRVGYPGADFKLGAVFAHPLWALPSEELVTRPGFRAAKEGDRAEAARLVRAAGGAIPLTIMTSPQYPSFYIDRAQVFKAQLEAVGFRVELEPAEYSAFKERERSKRYALTTGTWAFYNDPDALLTGSFGANGARNYFSYNSPRFESLLERERAETDTARRRDLVFEAQRLLLDERPLAAFTAWFLSVQMGLRKDVRGLRLGGNGPTGVNAGEEAYQAKSIWLDR